jgi:molecular chaperone IbpA
MRSYDFSPLYRSAIGFDQFARVLDDALHSDALPSYPPYNVELIEENTYRITMAVAGFDRADLDIEFERGTLKVVGHRNKQATEQTFLHRGIAERDFEHRFRVADHVKVTGANLDRGLLQIDLVREIPEALKARRIEIGGGGVNSSVNSGIRSPRIEAEAQTVSPVANAVSPQPVAESL